MVSINFVIENDQPKALSATGDLLDIVGGITYLIGKIHHTLNAQDSAAGSALQKMLTQVISDPESPVWQMSPEDGEIALCSVVPKPPHDPSV